jgi:hypothetical protein
MTNTDTVLEIESRLNARKEEEEMQTTLMQKRFYDTLPEAERNQLTKIAGKIKFMFKSETDIFKLEMLVFQSVAKGCSTLNNIEQIVNNSGQGFYKKGSTIEKMLSIIEKSAKKVNNPIKKQSLVDKFKAKFNKQ